MRQRNEYTTTTNYALDWGSDSGTISRVTDGSREDAMASAHDVVERMRREGAASNIRSVRVRHWGDWDRPLYHASYYDSGQQLTDVEVYAARVHDWHVTTDVLNAHYARTNAQLRAGYGPWSNDWGTKPVECPACSAVLTD